MKKPTSLDAVLARKAAIAPAPAERSEAQGETRTLTLRLPPIAHDQLREMAFAARRSQHSLLVEALNQFFERNGKPPVAG